MQALLLRGFVGSKMKLPMLVTVIVLDGLQGVGVMADEHIGSSVYQHVGIVPLTGYGLQRMFATPVERDDDDSGGVSLTETEDALEQRVHRFLTHAGLIGQVGVVLEGVVVESVGSAFLHGLLDGLGIVVSLCELHNFGADEDVALPQGFLQGDAFERAAA